VAGILNKYQTSLVVVFLGLIGLPVAVAAARVPDVEPQDATTLIGVALEQRSLAGCAKLLIAKNTNVHSSRVSCFMAYIEFLDASKV
jgi:hypothetical protein